MDWQRLQIRCFWVNIDWDWYMHLIMRHWDISRFASSLRHSSWRGSKEWWDHVMLWGCLTAEGGNTNYWQYKHVLFSFHLIHSNIKQLLCITNWFMLTVELISVRDGYTEINMENYLGRHDRSSVIQRHQIHKNNKNNNNKKTKWWLPDFHLV